ncbi:MAG: hypothetical protein IPJ18_20365 [Betaproteobacteria bacterium]|nr:hypothetical protein [Betaproteobacteria bacterium]
MRRPHWLTPPWWAFQRLQVVLTEHVQAAPDHLTVVKLDDGFSPQSWLEGWMQQHQPQEKLSHKLTQSAKVAH